MTPLLFLIKAALLWTAGLVLTGLLRRSAAATRELVWRGVCVGVVSLPLLAPTLPRWSVPAPQAPAALARLEVPAGSFAPIALEALSAEPAALASSEGSAGPAPASSGGLPWAQLALALWALGAAVVLWPWVCGRLALRRALRGACPAPDQVWREELAALVARLGLRRRVELTFLEQTRVPLLWAGSLGGPARLVLPRGAAAWERARVRSVLLHELAHLERGDGPARLLARVALALTWPLPQAWWGHRRMQLEAERACDDRALGAGTSPVTYAEHLLAVALDASDRGPLDALAPAMARASELDRRIAGVLEASRRRRPPARRAVCAAALAGGLLLLPLAALGQDTGQDTGAAPPAGDPGPAADTALERGLEWLLAAQDPDTGAWSGDIGYKLSNGYRTLARDAPHVGATATALMALLDAGALPGDGPRGLALRRGGRFLVSALQTEPGYAQFAGTGMKSHALALEALARLYALTRDGDLGAAVAKAVDWTVRNQNGRGGWRYRPYAQDSDVLHTASLLRALEAAAAAGVEVPAHSMDRARAHVAEHRNDDPAGFRYQTNELGRISAASSAAGLVAQRAGGTLEHAFRTQALDRLPALLESQEQALGDNALVWHARDRVARALEAWAVDVEDRTRWESFRTGMQLALRKSQLPDGSWACEGGPGAVYATAVACRLLAR